MLSHVVVFCCFVIAGNIMSGGGIFKCAAAGEPVIRGTIKSQHPSDAPIRVWSVKLQVGKDGKVVPPPKPDIFAASIGPGQVVAKSNGDYELPVEAGRYCVFAIADLDRNGRWDPQTPEPLGWYATQLAGGFEPVVIDEGGATGIDFALRSPHLFPREDRKVPGGVLRWVKGYPVLELHGDARTRGFAHGKLIAPQIVDFFRFYILEDKLGSARDYEAGFAKFLQSHFAYPQAFVAECEAVIEGMRASGEDLYLPEFSREFSLTDLYAINCYIETRAMRSSCTQFAAWGKRTEGTDVDGGMIAGRNMDGEIDIRKVTVSHFLLFAVAPSEPGQKRYVSMMWPGFVATLSGMNEDGFYCMENAGMTAPGKVVDRLVPFAWTMRESLARLGADATPNSVQTLVDSFDNSAGGACGPGCITLFAMPFRGQRDPAFVLEGDRFGDAIRLAGMTRPKIAEALMLSNHFRRYGVTPDQPDANFGQSPTFSSAWRYEAGMNKLEAWRRTDRKIGIHEMRELLQAVAHGTTEHSIIARPNRLEFDVALASLKAEPWDAPYRDWTTFRFDELFSLPPSKPALK